jgi:hypothetical protein
MNRFHFNFFYIFVCSLSASLFAEAQPSVEESSAALPSDINWQAQDIYASLGPNYNLESLNEQPPTTDPEKSVEQKSIEADSEKRHTSIEARVAALFYASKRIRHLFGDVAPNYQIEVSRQFNRRWEGWTDIDFTDAHSKRRSQCCKSDILMYDLSLGLKYAYPLHRRVDVYLGLGPNLALTHIRNTFCCHRDVKWRFSVGAVAKSGIRFYSKKKTLFLDFFVDYLYQPIEYHGLNIGGVKPGLALGGRF